MKNTLLVLLSMVSFPLIAQVSSPTNNPIAPGIDFVGWNAGNLIPVEIKNEDTYPINFYTSGGSTTFNNLRTTIFEDNVTQQHFLI